MGQTLLQHYISLAKEGTKVSIGEIMKHLNKSMTLAESKFIDFALGHVDNDEGVKIMKRKALRKRFMWLLCSQR
jgi:hypothetical protein